MSILEVETMLNQMSIPEPIVKVVKSKGRVSKTAIPPSKTKEYTANYYKSKYSMIRKITYYIATFHLPVQIVNLPQTNESENLFKLNAMKRYVDNKKKELYITYVEEDPFSNIDYIEHGIEVAMESSD